MRIQSEKYKVRNKVEKLKFSGQRTKGIEVILTNINSPGERIGWIVLYDLKNQLQETGNNTSI